MTTGETANGRSISASSSRLPRKRAAHERERGDARRRPCSAAPRSASISIVSQNALIAAGVVIESQTAPKPCSNVR